MAAVVVDSCLAVKRVIVQDYTAEARDFLVRWNAAGDALFAPAVFRSEVANALYKYVHRGPGRPKQDTITLDEAKLLLKSVLGIVQVMPVASWRPRPPTPHAHFRVHQCACMVRPLQRVGPRQRTADVK